MFHRIDDMSTMDGPRFFRFAFRLAAYRGVLRARVQALSADNPSPPAAQVVPADRATLTANGFDDVISFG